MPGQRAEDVKIRHIGADKELWDAVKVKAERLGMSASEATRMLWRSWLAESE